MTTAETILQNDFANLSSWAKRKLSSSRAVVDLPSPSRDLILRQIGPELRKLGTIEIGDVLQRAWSTSRTLNQAARRSLASGRSEPVHLDGYAMPVDYEPKLEVYLGGPKPAMTVHFRLRLTLKLFNFDGVFEHGSLVRLSCQTFTVKATLTVAGHALAKRTVQLNLDLELPLPPGGIPFA